MKLSGKVAIVTGSGGKGGIGAAIVERFASEGASVVVNALHIEHAQEVADEIKNQGGTAIAIKADVSNRAEVQDLVNGTLENFKAIHILVNNAAGGTGHKAPIVEMTEEDWDRGIDVTLKGVFNCIQAVLPHMMKQRYGKIISTSSVKGIGAIEVGDGVYGPAKAGVIMLTKVAATEAGPYEINVNAIAPGFILVPKFYTQHGKEETERMIERLKKASVLGRAGKPGDIANLALFLASDEANFITGQVICCDGGRTNLSS